MKKYTRKLGEVVQIDENQIQEHLGELVRGTVEENLNRLSDVKPIDCAIQSDMRKPKGGEIPGQGIMIDKCRPRLGRFS